MPRSVLILLVLLVLGIAGGLLLKLSKPFEKSPAVARTEAPVTPPAIESPSPVADFQQTADMLNPGGVGAGTQSPPAGDQQVKILQDQVDYLQQQVATLQKENSSLIDKLGSIQRGTNAATTQPKAPCAPPMPASDGEEPDFVGIGIELVKTRSLEELPVPTLTVERKEVEKRIAKWLGTQFPRDYGVKQGRALASLGVIPAPVNTIGLKAAFLSYQLGGWFDTDEQTLFMAPPPDLGVGQQTDKENALALAYGYVFKHFGASLFPADPKPPTLDARLAKESVVAGDASLIRFLHSLQNPEKGGGGGVGEDPDDPSRAVPIPNFLREIELLPFSVGMDFMQSMHSVGEWEQVNATYKRPPISGAELLDPQTYLQETPFTLEPLGGNVDVSGKHPLWQDTLGPMATVILLKQYIPEPMAADTSPGWANDELLTYAANGESRDHAVWRTVWRNSDAADAFFGAMRQSMVNKNKGAKTASDQPAGTFQISTPGHVMLLKRTHNGSGVLYVDAVDAEFAKAAQEKFAP